MKSHRGNWGSLFEFEGDEANLTPSVEWMEDSLGDAHEALNRLSQKANKRGRMMKHPRRAESWH